MSLFDDPRKTLFDIGLTEITLAGKRFLLEKQRPVGRGGSCLVYYARKQEAPGLERRIILKEFYPLVRLPAPGRKADGSLCPDLQDPETAFRLERFHRSRELSVILHNEETINPNVAEIQECIHANGTEYMVVGYSSGMTLQEYLAEARPSLQELLALMRKLALVLEHLHGLGYLHMDLKPDNILCLPGGDIRIIDTDSILHRNELSREDVVLSCSRGFAPPEILDCAQDRKKLRDVAGMPQQVDIYSLGAILYFALFGVAPQPVPLHRTKRERMEAAFSLMETLRGWLPEITGSTAARFDKLLTKALAAWPKGRWSSVGEFRQLLDELLPLADPDRIRIQGNFKPNSYPVEGRQDKLMQLRQFFESQPGISSRMVCIFGLGGIGKSTLARQYADDHRNEYDVIVEVSAASAREAIRDIPILHWDPDPNLPDERQDDLRVQMLSVLCQKQRTLLIVHNYDVSTDPSDSFWKRLGCDIILTSRFDWHDPAVPSVCLHCSDLTEENALRIFDHFYFGAQKPRRLPSQWEEARQQDALKRLMFRVNYHPLGIKLYALHMASVPGLTPSVFLEELTQTAFQKDSPVVFTTRSSHGLLDENIHGHLQIIFRTALLNGSLSPLDLDALRNMLLTDPNHGISAQRFSRWSGMCTSHLEQLRRKGWLDLDPDRQDPLDPQPHSGIYLMPLLLQQVLWDSPDMSGSLSRCKTFLNSAGSAITGHYRTADQRRSLCQEQQRLLELLKDLRTEECARLYNTAAANLYNFNPLNSPQDTVLEYSDQCITILKELGMEDHPLIPDSYHNMGVIYQQLDQRQDAYNHLAHALHLEKTYKKASIGQTAQTELAIAGLHWEVGRMKKALAMAEAAFQTLSPERKTYIRDFIFACSCLGRYLQTMGHPDQAADYLRQALALCEDHLNDAADSTRDTCHGILLQLGSVYLDLQEPDEAIRCLLRSLEQAYLLYGEDAFSTALEVHLALAEAYTMKDDRASAITHRETLLQIYRDNQDPDSWTDSETFVYNALNDQSFDIRKLHLDAPDSGSDFREWILADSMLHLALDYAHLDPKKPQIYLLAATAAFRATLGQSHMSLSQLDDIESVYDLYYQLADKYFCQGNFPMGLNILEKGAFLSRRIFRNSCETGEEYRCLSRICKDLGLPRKADRYRKLAESCEAWSLGDRIFDMSPFTVSDLEKITLRNRMNSRRIHGRKLKKTLLLALKHRRKKDRE